MAQHEYQWDLTEEAIEEYLEAIRYGLKFRKSDGGCLGYPSALLMFCLIDAFGTYLRGEEVTIDGRARLITKREPFWVLNHPLFGQQLTEKQIKQLGGGYRNALAHNATIESGAALFPGKHGEAFNFKDGKVVIFVGALHTLIEAAWKSFDKRKIKAFVEKRQPIRPQLSCQ